MDIRHAITILESALVNEIHKTPASDFGPAEIRDGIRDALSVRRKRLGMIDDVAVSIGDDGPHRKFVIFAEDRIALGFAELEQNTIDGIAGWYMTRIGLKDDLRGRNIGYRFYHMLLDVGMTLFSGRMQTPASQATWKKLMADTDVQTSVHNVERDVRGQDVDPYADFDNVIIARKR